MHSSPLPNMVSLPGKDSLQLSPQTNTPLRGVRAISLQVQVMTGRVSPNFLQQHTLVSSCISSPLPF